MTQAALYRAGILLLSLVVPVTAWAQDNPAGDKPPSSSTKVDPTRNGESSPRQPDARGAPDASAGGETTHGTDGKPAAPAGSGSGSVR